MDSNRFAANIIAAAGNYQNQSDYSAFAGFFSNETNSNSFAFTMLRRALMLDIVVITTPEMAAKMGEDWIKIKPTVNRWRVPGWDVNVP